MEQKKSKTDMAVGDKSESNNSTSDKPKAIFSFIQIDRLYNHHDIYFEAKDNPVHLAIAPNGSGKTTIARFLLQFLNSAHAGKYKEDDAVGRYYVGSHFISVLNMAKTLCCQDILVGFKLPNQNYLCFIIYPTDSESIKKGEAAHHVAMDVHEYNGDPENLKTWQVPDLNKEGLTSNSLKALLKYDFQRTILLDANKLASQSDYNFYQQLFEIFNDRFSLSASIANNSLEACGMVNCARFQQEISLLLQSPISESTSVNQKPFTNAFLTWLTYVLQGYENYGGPENSKYIRIANDIRKKYAVYLKPIVKAPNGLAHKLNILAGHGKLHGALGCRSILWTDRKEQSLIKFSNLFYDYITNAGFVSLIELYFEIKKAGGFSLLEIDLSNKANGQANKSRCLNLTNIKWEDLKYYSIFPKNGENQHVCLRPEGEVIPFKTLHEGVTIDIAVKRVNDIIIIRDAFENLCHLPLFFNYNHKEIQVGKIDYEGLYSGGNLLLQKLSSGEKALLEILCSFSLGKFDRYDPTRDELLKNRDVDEDPVDFIIIDEPENSLHISWQEQLVDILNSLAKRNGKEALIFTHSPHIIANSLDSLCEVEMSNANGKLY